ncbi:MAG: hypothetical protein HQ579_01920 [Candidatus Omnitrophica bacterium]|nr:hypothetical protein [Candidatus Omnitrophota bacterium]
MSKKILIMLMGTIIVFSVVNSAFSQHDEYLNEQRGSIVEAIKEKADLKGMNKQALRLKFGYPVNISAHKTEAGDEEIWIYRPYEGGSYRIKIILINDIVVDYEYREKFKKDKGGET